MCPPQVAGIFGGTWTASGLSHLGAVAITYSIFNWPEEVWIALIGIVPLENLIRSFVGMVIGCGVIAGLRAIGRIEIGATISYGLIAIGDGLDDIPARVTYL